MLLAHRVVKHFYSEPVRVNFVSIKASSSLGYQMEKSLEDLETELRAQGKDYDFAFLGGFYGNELDQWELYINGEHFATIDDDYGYDCFDISATHFKDTIGTLLETSGIEPLTTQERKALDTQREAEKMAKTLSFSGRVEAINREEENALEEIRKIFARLKRLH